jgi:pimeloyl-ACP methyl ester carboxylesterase
MVSRYGLLLLICSLAIMTPSCAGCPQLQVKARRTGGDCVVLLHGLARSCRSMQAMEKALVLAGFQTVNLDYSSREKTIEEIADQDFVRGLRLCEETGASQVHFVTHSLGGIIVRQAMAGHRPENLGRVVMLSPPNRGSFVADRLKDWWLYHWLNGPAGQELGTREDELPRRLGPVDYPVGVITGDRHAWFDAWFASLTAEKNDGKVSVEEARLDGMADFLVVPETHPFIMNSDEVIKQTVHFLRQGTFIHPPVPSFPEHPTD